MISIASTGMYAVIVKNIIHDAEWNTLTFQLIFGHLVTAEKDNSIVGRMNLLSDAWIWRDFSHVPHYSCEIPLGGRLIV